MYKINGTRQVYNHLQNYSIDAAHAYDLTITDAQWQVIKVLYDWKAETAFVSVQFSWDNWLNQVERTYNIPCPSEWTTSDALTELLGMDEFANSIIID